MQYKNKKKLYLHYINNEPASIINIHLRFSFFYAKLKFTYFIDFITMVFINPKSHKHTNLYATFLQGKWTRIYFILYFINLHKDFKLLS